MGSPHTFRKSAIFLVETCAARAKKTGLTQKDVERITGVTQAFLSNIEKGKTNSSLDTMVILSKGLSVPIWKLFLPFDAQDN